MEGAILQYHLSGTSQFHGGGSNRFYVSCFLCFWDMHKTWQLRRWAFIAGTWSIMVQDQSHVVSFRDADSQRIQVEFAEFAANSA